jgi:hypothetical protein
VIPSLWRAPVVSLEIWPIIVSNWASGSNSSAVGEKIPFPLAEDVLGLVRWLGDECRLLTDAVEEAVSRGEVGRLEDGENDRLV